MSLKLRMVLYGAGSLADVMPQIAKSSTASTGVAVKTTFARPPRNSVDIAVQPRPNSVIELEEMGPAY
jgi:hypothetical protein